MGEKIPAVSSFRKSCVVENTKKNKIKISTFKSIKVQVVLKNSSKL